MKRLLSLIGMVGLLACATVPAQSPLTVLGDTACVPVRPEGVSTEIEACVQVLYYNDQCQFFGAQPGTDPNGIEAVGLMFLCPASQK